MSIPAPEPAGAEATVPPGPLLRLIRDQRVAFLLVGGFNTVLAFALFTLLHATLDWWVQFELLLAQQLTLLVAFVLHRRFVFRVHGHLVRDFLRFELVSLGALVVNELAITLLVTVLGWPTIPSQLLITAAIVVFTFFAHRDFSFRRPAAAGESPGPDR